ncbi:MAG: hypothetical protein F4Z13_02410 [Candidatus Dadabacteria bacterium]|nr:hypothetical protein [Candidatus Dadabacteria bacterium]
MSRKKKRIAPITVPNKLVEDPLLNLFLERETLMLTINGALNTRNRNYPIYCNTDKKKRDEFRESLRGQLNLKLEEYRAGEVQDDRHIANIKNLSYTLSRHHHEILFKGKFRIGTAQKALNLYLKYGWARGIIPEPPHCPIDSIVLKEINKYPSDARCEICRKTWTEIDTIEEYLHFIDKARIEANKKGQTLARWELGIWQTATFKS